MGWHQNCMVGVGEKRPLELPMFLYSACFLHLFEIRMLSFGIRAINLGLMTTKKMEGRLEGMEEQTIGVHGEVLMIKGDLQRLGPLEVKVDLMLEKLSMLERMDKMLQNGRRQRGLHHPKTRWRRAPPQRTPISG